MVSTIMLRKNLLNFKLIFEKYGNFPDLFESFKANFRPELERCPFCNALGQCRKYGSYERYLTDIDHGEIIDRSIKIPRVMCVCGHTHGVIPDSIVPYRWYSLPFILYVLNLYFSGSIKLVDICTIYKISHSTLYRWMSIYLEHKLWWFGALQSDETTAIAFINILLGYEAFSDFTHKFFLKSLYSFLQHHANPANCNHLPPGGLPVQGAATERGNVKAPPNGLLSG